MLRAIITAVLLTAAAVHLGAPTDDALGYSIVAAGGAWYLWPVLRRVPRAGRSARRMLTPRSRAARPAAAAHSAPVRPAPAPGQGGGVLPPALTQINHHHHYYGEVPHQLQWPADGQARPGLLGLPRKGCQQIAHDIVFTSVDPNHG